MEVKKMMERDMSKLIMLCRDKKLDFDITCCAKETKEFILNLMDCPARIVVDKVEYYVGKKYEVLMYNLKLKKGDANFNSKSYWRAIHNIMREFDYP